ncbi:unnamed protein product [Aspergillus oryzae]|nr:unnamed protein product [Aspergillus oryzae]GMF88998.1 unnamed protein product [Aspergillus oryzae]
MGQFGQYHKQVELQNLTVTSHSVIDTTLEHFNITHLDKFIQALDEVNNTTGLNDFYSIGLWSYCTGNITDNGTYKTTYCSKPRGGFWFDPIDTWGLNGTNTNDFLPGKLKKSLNMYRNVSLWMAIIYLIAVIATVLEIMTGSWPLEAIAWSAASHGSLPGSHSSSPRPCLSLPLPSSRPWPPPSKLC